MVPTHLGSPRSRVASTLPKFQIPSETHTDHNTNSESYLRENKIKELACARVHIWSQSSLKIVTGKAGFLL